MLIRSSSLTLQVFMAELLSQFYFQKNYLREPEISLKLFSLFSVFTYLNPWYRVQSTNIYPDLSCKILSDDFHQIEPYLFLNVMPLIVEGWFHSKTRG